MKLLAFGLGAVLAGNIPVEVANKNSVESVHYKLPEAIYHPNGFTLNRKVSTINFYY